MEQLAYFNVDPDDKDDEETGEVEKLVVMMTDMITSTQTNLESNPNHLYKVETEMPLIWNTTQKK